MKKTIIASVILLALFSTGCRELYDIPDEAKNVKLLVVEGFLNSNGPTIIKLSRTVNLKDTAKIKPELNAVVKVEGENNTSFTLTGNIKGEYAYPSLTLLDNVKYRLRIKTTEGKEYLSDFVPVQKAPAIDSVNWVRKESGVETGLQIYVNTHDPQNQTKYYRWEFDETWEFHSPYYSNLEYKNGAIVPRSDPLAIFICWKNEPSNHILVGSSAKLSQDIISLAPVTIIPFNSIRISVRYSILVRQYALTEKGFEYWDLMKKNTEQLGTLFDPQPSTLFSNIHCLTTPDEPVIGYVSAGAVSEKRIFITNNEAYPWVYRYPCPDEVQISNNPSQLQFWFAGHLLIPTREIYNMFGILVGYYASDPPCVDCTLSGTNVKPSFW